jgi:lysozyme family protein
MMSEYKARFSHTLIDPSERARRLSKVYAFILSWPDRSEKVNTGGEVTGSAVENQTQISWWVLTQTHLLSEGWTLGAVMLDTTLRVKTKSAGRAG